MKLLVSRLTRRISFLQIAVLSLACLAGCSRKSPHTGTRSPATGAEAAQARLDWNLKTLVNAYQKSGRTDPRWDEPAQNALTEFARMRSPGTVTNSAAGEAIATNCEAAVNAGCNDPLILYLHTRFALSQTNSSKVFADKFSQIAVEMQQSSYPAIRKFYASRMATEQLYYAFGTNVDLATLRAAGGKLIMLLAEAVSDKTMPPGEAYDACEKGLEAYKGNADQYAKCFHAVEESLLQNWPDSSEPLLIKAQAYITLAWAARGSGLAKTVTEEGWKSFKERLDVAESALDRAWKLNPNDVRIPIEMLTVELGQGQGRQRMERWFDRAMNLDPNSYEACKKKLYYLEPKWYGSRDALLEFGHECTRSKTWGGKVPLILLDAHEAISGYEDRAERSEYWKRPEVWPDIQESFDRFFELNPDATTWYHNYCRYAALCEQWAKVNELIPKLGEINYSYFGGKAEFEQMVNRARAATK